MPGWLATLVVGLGTALALSLPAALVAQILDAERKGDLSVLVIVPLAAIVLLGALAGGWAVARRAEGRRSLAGLVGAVALGLVVGLGQVRAWASEERVYATVVPIAMAAGAALGIIGAALGTRPAARTRR